ncbi:hypothetical protein ANO14919_094240 [Xylariales sp. No.14919]|nr:hypothetical protein F5X98DRAFT_350518 [Xylaria grammica]GAW19931.1 hypothetical protein ANO14919_094240 [Xylariales sp. No.14919]
MSQSQQFRDNRDGSDSTSPPDPHQQETHHSHSPSPSAATTQSEMIQAFRDLARGEQQAAAIEANLASIESKLDALLASVEAGAGAAKADGIEDDSKKEQLP